MKLVFYYLVTFVFPTSAVLIGFLLFCQCASTKTCPSAQGVLPPSLPANSARDKCANAKCAEAKFTEAHTVVAKCAKAKIEHI